MEKALIQSSSHFLTVIHFPRASIREPQRDSNSSTLKALHQIRRRPIQPRTTRNTRKEKPDSRSRIWRISRFILLQLLQSSFPFARSPSVGACARPPSHQRWAEGCNRVAVGSSRRSTAPSGAKSLSPPAPPHSPAFVRLRRGRRGGIFRCWRTATGTSPPG